MTATVTAVGSPRPRTRTLRLIPALEAYPRVVAVAQTWPGKALLLAYSAVLLGFLRADWLWVVGLLALTSFFPQRRRAVVALGTTGAALLLPNLEGLRLGHTAATLLVFALGGALFAAARRFPNARFLRRPVMLLIAGFVAYVALIAWQPAALPGDAFAWQVAAALATYQWFIGYALLDRSSPQADGTLRQVGTFAPFWGSTCTPYPKGASNLRKIEARTATDLAVTQLKGMKLLLWCLLLLAAHRLFLWVAYSRLQILPLTGALDLIAHGRSPGWLACWSSVLCNFGDQLFAVTLLGHQIIACCRLAGFAALRNTYRPFESRTIADFWNRYYYYFKELLVDFFYYPAFVRYFKAYPRLRRYFAVFAAVFVGDLYYHLFRNVGFIRLQGFWHALAMMDVYAVQCALLTVAICFSQARGRAVRRSESAVGRGLALARVILFYCFMFSFVDESFTFSLGVHVRLFGSLLGLPIQ